MKIVLDADGVLLDYNQQMAIIYEKATNQKLKLIKVSHHFKNMYGVSFSAEEKQAIYSLFDKEGWTNMPAIKGAVVATNRLKSAGHTLLCLSSMPSKFVNDRTENFKQLGIPIEHVVGSNRDENSTVNPKAIHLIEMSPDIFVDDQLRNFEDVPDTICKIWIDNQFNDSPDIGLDPSIADHRFESLSSFVDKLIECPDMFKKNKQSFKYK